MFLSKLIGCISLLYVALSLPTATLGPPGRVELSTVSTPSVATGEQLGHVVEAEARQLDKRACNAGFIRCGNVCLVGTTCPSNLPRRRELAAREIDNLCPIGFEPCMLPTATMFTGDNYECIRTSSDLESCGGCVYPLPGRRSGTDCSAIPHVASATCSSGQCQIETCLRGFVSNGFECVAEGGFVDQNAQVSSFWRKALRPY